MDIIFVGKFRSRDGGEDYCFFRFVRFDVCCGVEFFFLCFVKGVLLFISLGNFVLDFFGGRGFWLDLGVMW